MPDPITEDALRPAPGEDWLADDPALLRFLALHEDAATLKAAEPLLAALGTLGPSRLDALAREADRPEHRPVLRPPDGVEYGPAYRELQRAGRTTRAFTAAWHPLGERARAPRTVHFALGYLYAQGESGYYCPGCMTDGAAWVLDRHAPAELRDFYVPRLVQNTPEGAFEGAMLLTERSGGSDLGGTTTRAERTSEGGWRVHGEKYFASNAGAEVILALARLPGAAPRGTEGLGLFLVPRVLPDGSRNAGIRLVKLKDKLGVTSMATAELEFDGAKAFLLAGEGHGLKAMVEMVNLSRLYNSVASVAVARRALREALRWGQAREAFGVRLLDQPLYRLRMVDLAVQVEGALAFVLEAASLLERADREPGARDLLRALTPLAKACTGKLAVQVASEACEALGGRGYIEDQSATPRLLRDAQVLPIWEGTTSVQCLDFLRALERSRAGEALDARAGALLAEAGTDAALQPIAQELRAAWDLLGQERAALAQQPREVREGAAWRMVRAHYHAFTAALLLAAAAREREPERARATAVAQAYAAAHVRPGGAAGEAVVERIARDQGLQVLLGARARV